MRLALFLAVMIGAGGGCAAVDNADQGPASPGMRDVDEAKMQQVEDVAAQRGVRVQWVNPPRKSTPAEGG